jgi:hypothetical protein
LLVSQALVREEGAPQVIEDEDEMNLTGDGRRIARPWDGVHESHSQENG